SWRVVPQPPMVVDIWESLPEMDIAPLPVEPPLAAPPKEISEPAKVPTPTRPIPVKTVDPTLPSKAEIELAEKKKKIEKEEEKEALRKKKSEQEAMKALKLQEAAQEAAKVLKLQEAAQEAAKALKLQEAAQEAEQARKLQESEQAERARAQSEKMAASNSIVNDFKAKIHARIKRNIKWPEEGRITAVYEVTLLPDGSVLESTLVQPSGNPAYDRATKSAIEAAQPLPLPKPHDPALFRQFFRNIQLKFSPTE
ncbi:MAG: cell envelope integrity protein TolA, partial [Candidatus Nitrotoga sp.]